MEGRAPGLEVGTTQLAALEVLEVLEATALGGKRWPGGAGRGEAGAQLRPVRAGLALETSTCRPLGRRGRGRGWGSTVRSVRPQDPGRS